MNTAINWHIREYLLLHDKNWKIKAGKCWNRYFQGNSRVNILKDFFSIVALGGLYTGLRLSWPLWNFIFIGVGIMLLFYSIGYWDEFFGFWGEQNKHAQSGRIQPVIDKIANDIKEIKQKLK